jgi:hypothetical protein
MADFKLTVRYHEHKAGKKQNVAQHYTVLCFVFWPYYNGHKNLKYTENKGVQ